MHDFTYKNGELYCEGVPVRNVAHRVGTPFYLYSSSTLTKHVQAFDSAFEGLPHLICFALKSNSNGAVLRLLGREGAGADIVSGGELFRALRAGIAPRKIVYAGVGKRRDEIEYAIESASSCSTSSPARNSRPSTRPQGKCAPRPGSPSG
jgi:diaminopimelate decarboxylase